LGRMQLLLIRHGIAAPLGNPAERDEDRQLTAEGVRRMRRVARGLRQLVPRPRAILSSPLMRARQTAEIVAQRWDGLEPVPAPALVRGDWEDICRDLASYGAEDTIVLVGHESWISTLTARLLGSQSGPAFGFRKGGVALIDVEQPSLARGSLRWFMPPRVLRRLR
jgi:phosphohistidine phosphatase